LFLLANATMWLSSNVVMYVVLPGMTRKNNGMEKSAQNNKKKYPPNNG